MTSTDEAETDQVQHGAMWYIFCIMPFVGLLICFSVSPELPAALIDKNIDAQTNLQVGFAATTVTSALPASWLATNLTRELLGNEDEHPYTWALLSIVSMPIVAFAIAIIGTISRLVWSCF